MSKTSTIALTCALTVFAASAVAAQDFEGVVTQRTISIDRYALEERGFDMSNALFDEPVERILALRGALEESGNMTVGETQISVKGSLIRMDMVGEDGPTYVTIDVGQGIMRMVQPSQRMYIEMTPADMERMASMRDAMGLEAPSEDPEPVATGQTRTIAGLSTEAFDVEGDDGMTRVWVSKDNPGLVKAFAALMERVDQMSMEEDTDDAARLIAKHGFPVLSQRLSYDTYEIDEMISLERKPVSDDLFVPPADFRKMTVADMMGGR